MWLRGSTLQKWLSPSVAPAAVLAPISEPGEEKMPSPEPCRSHEHFCVSGIWSPWGPCCQHHPNFLMGAVEKRDLLPRSESSLCWLCPPAVDAAQADCSVVLPLFFFVPYLLISYLLVPYLLLLIPGTCRGAGDEVVLGRQELMAVSCLC